MNAERAVRPPVEVGCVLARETGVLVVLTDDGRVRATYGPDMLGAIAVDLSRVPEPGEWVSLRRWCDGPHTVEGALTRSSRDRLAPVLPLPLPSRPRESRANLGD